MKTETGSTSGAMYHEHEELSPSPDVKIFFEIMEECQEKKISDF